MPLSPHQLKLKIGRRAITFSLGFLALIAAPMLISIRPQARSTSEPATELALSRRDGQIDSTFGTVLSLSQFGPDVTQALPLADGKMLVAGSFTVVNGRIKEGLARMNADGTLDDSLAIHLTNSQQFVAPIVKSVQVDANGQILIGGLFETVNGTPARNIARLNPNGTLDPTFNIDTGFSGSVNQVVLRADGKILVGGDFHQYNGTVRDYLAQLDANGSLDTSFVSTITASSTGAVQKIALPGDGHIYLQGKFTKVNGLTRLGFARLNQDGSLDAAYVGPGTYSFFVSIQDFALRSDGKIYVAGLMEIRQNSVLVCQNLCLLNNDGSLDTSFFVTFSTNGAVGTLFLRPDNRLLIQGSFETVGGTPRSGVAALNSNGSMDATFNPNFSLALEGASFHAFVPLSDGSFVLPGTFTAVNGMVAENLAKIDQNGNFIPAFTPHFNLASSEILSSLALPDGGILVGGRFTRANDLSRIRLAKLNPDGSVNMGFDAETSNGNPGTYTQETAGCMALQSDGKILIGGSFLAVNGQSRKYLARLNPDGTTDTTFNPAITFGGSGGGEVLSIAVQSDGKIVIVGAFDTVSAVTRKRYARLNADGTLDTTFAISLDPAFQLELQAVALQPDGKILIGGNFRLPGNSANYGVARFHGDGSLDPTFVLPADPILTPYVVSALAVQPNGKILAGGSANSIPRPMLARFNSDGTIDASFRAVVDIVGSGSIRAIIPQPNRKILIGGKFTSVNGNQRRYVARLIENGGLDYGFASPAIGPVTSMSMLPTGDAFITGQFDKIDGQYVTGIARLLIRNHNYQPNFDFDGDGKDDQAVFRPSAGAWYVLRSQAGFSGTPFGNATDKIAPADFDGDGRTDISVFRDGVWYWLNSSNNSLQAVQFGAAGDTPVPADYDGDGRADQAVYRSGVWYLLQSQAGFTGFQFGIATDKPVPGDFDGDGKTDAAVYRDGVWYLLQSQLGFGAVQFGIAIDRPVVGDYDGDGRSDQAVYRDGIWYVLGSSVGFQGVQFGIASDLPVPADYDGDGKTDEAVYRDGVWYLLRSQLGFGSVQFGNPGDKPIPAAYVP